MNMVKSLILSSAAGLIAMSGAQAADLPVKAKAVEYVKVCSLYGAGFYYIPGTDTCIKLSGYLRAEMAVNTNSVYTGNTSGAGGAKNRYTNAFTWRSREDFDIDTRTATEYGVVRTYFDATFTWTSDTYAGNGASPGSTIYGALGGGSLALGTSATGGAVTGQIAPATLGNNASSGVVAGGTLGVYYAFIQFAGFTMGKAISQFSAPWTAYPGNNYDGLVGGGGTVTGVNQFTYTWEMGNGMSAAVSVQDPTAYYQAGVNNITAGGFGANDISGTVAPDIVGMFRVDQAWGLFQLSAAAHDNTAAYYAPGLETSGHPGDRWGYAVQAALSIKNIPTGPGDTINVQGVYTNGATRYNIQDLAGAAGAATIYGGNTGTAVGGRSIGFGIAPDSVFAGGAGSTSQQQLIETWGFRGAYTHNWNAYWNSGIYGAYADVRYTAAAKALVCGAGTFAAITVTTCNPDYSIAQLGFITRWTPVKNLTFSVDYTYTHLDQKMAGTVTSGSVAIGKPTELYTLSDQDTHQVLLRAQRNW